MIKEEDGNYIKTNSNNLTINELYDYFNEKYSKKQLRNYCTNNNLNYKKLTKEERAVISKNRKNKKQRQQTLINHDYFKTWSKNMAYIFGLWCADGNIGTQNKGYQFSIKLHKKDKYLLKDILDEMKSEHKIYENKENCCYFIIGSKTIYNDIIALGGMEKKSLNLKFPSVPSEYLPDFIRGYFDGDGCIAKTSNQVNIIGTIDFLNTIKDVLFDNGILISNICKKHPESKSNCYVLYICKKTEIIKFKNFIYKECGDNSLFLKRKKEIFDNKY